jgi:hypothetical protein
VEKAGPAEISLTSEAIESRQFSKKVHIFRYFAERGARLSTAHGEKDWVFMRMTAFSGVGMAKSYRQSQRKNDIITYK